MSGDKTRRNCLQRLRCPLDEHSLYLHLEPDNASSTTEEVYISWATNKLLLAEGSPDLNRKILQLSIYRSKGWSPNLMLAGMQFLVSPLSFLGVEGTKCDDRSPPSDNDAANTSDIPSAAT